MKFTTIIALGLATVSAPAIAAAQAKPAASTGAAADKPIQLSKKAGKTIIELQKLVNANDLANIPAKMAEAEAVAESPDDKYAIGQFKLKLALQGKDLAAASAAIDYLAASKFLTSDNVAKLYNSVGVEYFNAKNHAQALAMFQRSMSYDPNNYETYKLLAELQNATDKKAEAVQTMMKSIAKSEAAGVKQSEDIYKRAVAIAYQSENPLAVDLGRKWLAAYPSAESWGNSIAIYRNMQLPDVEPTIDLLRLMRINGAISSPNDYALYAQAASEQGNYIEAQSILDEGIAAGKITATSAAISDTYKALKSKPKPTLKQVQDAAGSVKTAKEMLSVGKNLYALGDYAGAADMFRKAQGAGADLGLSSLLLGMSLTRAGDKAGAKAAFEAVAGDYKGVAAYWLIYVNSMA